MDKPLMIKITRGHDLHKYTNDRCVNKASFSAWIVAVVFGVISPNKEDCNRDYRVGNCNGRTAKTVSQTCSNRGGCYIDNIVADQYAHLTFYRNYRLFLKLFLRAYFHNTARLPIRILLTVVSAVSADEKKAESINRIIKIISCVTSPESNDKSPLFSKI